MTHGYEDLLEPIGECELCEHPEIRHTFEIQNRINNNALWGGSKCIDKFVPLYQDGVPVHDPELKTRLLRGITGKLIDAARRERAERLLVLLSEGEPAFAASKWLEDWKKGYSVKQLQWIAVTAKKRNITFDSGDFRVNTRRGSIREQARRLQHWQYIQLRNAFPVARRNELDEYFSAGIHSGPTAARN